MLIDRPAFIKQIDIMPQNNSNDYILQVDFDNLLVNIINIKKGVKSMNEEIKYTILADDGNNISYEKAIVSTNETSRDKVSEYKERIEAIKAHIVEENREIEELEAKINELEQVVAIADEKKLQENQVVSEENIENAN